MFVGDYSKHSPVDEPSTNSILHEEPDLDFRGYVIGVGSTGKEMARDVSLSLREMNLLRTAADDVTFEPVFLFVAGTAKELLTDSEEAAVWRSRAWCHFALVVDKAFDSEDPDLMRLAEVYESVIPLQEASDGMSTPDVATSIVHANLEAVIKKGIVCVDYSDMATVLKYMGGILYARVVGYVPPQEFGPVMVGALLHGRESELLPEATGIVATCITDGNFGMVDFDDYGNAVRTFLNDATVVMAGAHGIHKLSSDFPGKSVLLCSFSEHNKERFLK